MIVDSPVKLLHNFLSISYENLMLDQYDKFNLISLSILITCLLVIVWILLGEITFQSLLGVKGLKSVPCRDNLKFQDNVMPQLIEEACETLKWDPKLCGANSYISLFLYFQSSLRPQMAIFRI